MSDFFSNWMKTAERFFGQLRQSEGEVEVEFRIEPTLDRTSIKKLQETLPKEIPPVLQEILEHITSGITSNYYWEPKESLRDLLKPLYDSRSYCGGGALFTASKFSGWFNDMNDAIENGWFDDDEKFEPYRQLWATSFPFFSLANGDYLAIADDGVRIAYLSHDDASFIVSESLEEFLTCWQAIGYAGPEHWVLKRFLDEKTKRFNRPSKEQHEQLQQLFGSLLN